MLKRYIFSTGANVVRAALSFATSVLLARWLGPVSYGDMAFLLGTFLGLRQLLDLGTGSAFFTFLSQRPRTWPFVRSFIYWLSIQFLVPIACIAAIFPDKWISEVWQGHSRLLVACAFAAAFSQNTLWSIAQSLAESARKTVFVQKLGMLASAIHLAAITLFMMYGTLGLYAVFIAILVEYSIVFCLVVRNHYVDTRVRSQLNVDDAPPGLIHYVRYCVPLIPLVLFGAVQEVVDRWLLQHYGGSASQGYFAFGYQIAGIAVLFISAIVRIFWKEIAEVAHSGDVKLVGYLFQKILRITRLIAGVAAGFVAVYAGELVSITAGPAYLGATSAMSILAVYVAYMAIGQLYSTLLMATGKVTIVGYLGTVLSALSIALAYLMLATNFGRLVGSESAAESLAIKMLAIEYVASILYANIVRRIWNVPSSVLMQLVCIAFGLTVASITRAFVVHVVAADRFVTVLVFGCLVYVLVFAISVGAFPKCFGLRDGDLRCMPSNS